MALNRGNRGERLEPCACGLRIRTVSGRSFEFDVGIQAVAWIYSKSDNEWHKTEKIKVMVAANLDPSSDVQGFGAVSVAAELARVSGSTHFQAEVRIELIRKESDFCDWEIELVNTSAISGNASTDTNLYECELEVVGIETLPFMLEALPDSFRYDRRVPCYGVNCGAEPADNNSFKTTDVPMVLRKRPTYWNAPGEPPDLDFNILAKDPVGKSRELAIALRTWGAGAWGSQSLALRARDGNWTDAMRSEAAHAALEFETECIRIEKGVELLEHDAIIRRSFVLMNRSMALASRHPRWRPFQLGFLLANLPSVSNSRAESEVADIVWFATGGGKTETYLGMILTAAFFDRLTGKTTGVTAWSRFPLRMLSLQQTQRFADALAGGERIRMEEGIVGDPFSLGFFVGEAATPNSIQEDPPEGKFDYDDDQDVKSAQVLLRCPFCRSETVHMVFDRRNWRLAHRCGAENCPWPQPLLPFYIVDDEIYRHLPTVIVGTLDKAALISMQASMRGLVGPPRGFCSESQHGYTYATRAKRPNGCLVPGCKGSAGPLPMEASRYGATYRLQDELHLLRDSLGAVDSHYEALYDDLQRELCNSTPKILASSATLEGYQRQVDVLYRRQARVFPVPGPTVAEGFWSAESSQLMRQYMAIAPRGVTLEFAVDRFLTELQTCIRDFAADPAAICREIAIDERFAPDLVSLYGTNVVYGNTIRDLDAVARSVETQIQVAGMVNTATLTGRTDFDEVRNTLHRLERPEEQFADRLHVITASSMMSHGVDIDRLNIMVMLGLPLTTAEFIQATARVGRTWPGLVFVVFKIARERDASMYRCFSQFVGQGDRLIEPIPITRRSRRVLDRTIAGLALSRMLMLHEPNSPQPLTTLPRVRDYLRTAGVDLASDALAVAQMLALAGERDAALRADIDDWYAQFARNIADPPAGAKFLSDVSPTGSPMLSLRDVEEQAPVHTRYT
jgi:hypothetical protein